MYSLPTIVISVSALAGVAKPARSAEAVRAAMIIFIFCLHLVGKVKRRGRARTAAIRDPAATIRARAELRSILGNRRLLLPLPVLHGERVGVRGSYECRRKWLPLTLTLSPF